MTSETFQSFSDGSIAANQRCRMSQPISILLRDDVRREAKIMCYMMESPANESSISGLSPVVRMTDKRHYDDGITMNKPAPPFIKNKRSEDLGHIEADTCENLLNHANLRLSIPLGATRVGPAQTSLGRSLRVRLHQLIKSSTPELLLGDTGLIILDLDVNLADG